jgi:hypothetical protein
MKPPPPVVYSREDDALMAALVANAEAKRAAAAAASAGTSQQVEGVAVESNLGFIDESPLPLSHASGDSPLYSAPTPSESAMGVVSEEDSEPAAMSEQLEPVAGLVSDEESEESAAVRAVGACMTPSSIHEEKQPNTDGDQTTTGAIASAAEEAKGFTLDSSALSVTIAEPSSDQEMSSTSELIGLGECFKVVEAPADADATMMPLPAASDVVTAPPAATAPESITAVNTGQVSVTCDSMSWIEWIAGYLAGRS